MYRSCSLCILGGGALSIGFSPLPSKIVSYLCGYFSRLQAEFCEVAFALLCHNVNVGKSAKENTKEARVT